jgi:hypothetical protein
MSEGLRPQTRPKSAIVQTKRPKCELGHAVIRAALHYARGDALKMAAWQCVADAIVVLDADQPAAGETVH